MSVDNQTFFVKARPDQIIGPLELRTIEAMVGARQLEPNVEVSSDQIIWVPLRQIQGHDSEFGHHPQGDQLWGAGAGAGFAQDAPLPGPLSDLRASQQGQFPGKPEDGPSYNADLFDAPYPGGGGNPVGAPLPGRGHDAGSTFLPGSPTREVPYPGGPQGSTALPGMNPYGDNVPQPGLRAEYPGTFDQAPGVAYPGHGSGGQTGGFQHEPVGNSSSDPYSSMRGPGGAAAPSSFESEARHAGNNRTILGAPNDSAFSPQEKQPQWEGGASFDQDLPYSVDDLFEGGGEAEGQQLFSTSEDAKRGATVLGKAAAAGSRSQGPSDNWANALPDDSVESPFNDDFKFEMEQDPVPGDSAQYSQAPLPSMGSQSYGQGASMGYENRPSTQASYAGYRTEPPPHMQQQQSEAEELPEVEPVEKKKQLPFLVVLGLIIGAFVLVVSIGFAIILVVDPFGFNHVPESNVAAIAEPTPAAEPPPAAEAPEAAKQEDEDPIKKEIAVIAAGPPAGTPLGLTQVVNDEYSDYQRLYKAAAALKDTNYTVLAEALRKARYGSNWDEPGSAKLAASLSNASGGVAALARGAWDAASGAADAARTYLELYTPETPVDRYYAIALGGVGDVIALRQYLAMKPNGRDAKRIDAYASSARRTFEQAIRIDANLPFAYFWLGQLAETLNEPDTAIAQYKKVLELQKYHVGATSRLAQLYVRQGQLEKSKESADTVINYMDSLSFPSEKADALVARGIVAILINDFNSAISSLKEALKFDPKNSEAYEVLMSAFALVDQNQEALHYFTTNEGFDQNSANVMIASSIADTNVGRLKEARDRLTKAEKQYPQDPRIPYRIALSFESDSNYTGAQNALRRALDKKKNYFDASIALARILWKGTQELKRSDAIIESLEPKKEPFPFLAAYKLGNYYLDTNRFQIANDYFRSALKTAPEFLEARLKLASVLTAQKRYDEALDILRTAPKSSAPPIQVGIASILLVQGDVAGAKKIADTVLNTEPDYLPAIILSVRAAIASGDYQSAEALIKKTANATGENYTEAYITKGLLAEAQGNIDNAKIIFESLIRFRPDAREVNYYLARNYLKTGNKTKALELYTRYINQASYKVPVIQAYLERGDLYLLNSIYKGAEADFNYVLQDPLASNEQKVKALIGLARVSMQNDQFQQAIKSLVASLEYDPDRAETFFDLGRAYANLGNSSESIKALDKAKELGYEDRRLDKLRGYAYLEQGRNAEAKSAFKAYIITLDKNRDEGELKEILQQLERLE